MIKQIVEIAHGSYLHLKDSQLVVEQGKQVVARVPIEDLGLLLLAHPANVLTQQVLAACQAAGVAVALCDENHLPVSLMLPLAGADLHAETLRGQVAAPRRIVNRLWRDIVVAKIEAQGHALAACNQSGDHLLALAKRVRTGNAAQMEAQAAAHYWGRLMGDQFRRDPQAGGVNALLNYGYAIVRAAVARAVVGAGLHPAWGLFHHNRRDSFALADDLMEPFRPVVDCIVWRRDLEMGDPLTPTLKRELLSLLSSPADIGDQPLPLWVALQRYAASARAVILGSTKTLEIPRWQYSAAIAPCG